MLSWMIDGRDIIGQICHCVVAPSRFPRRVCATLFTSTPRFFQGAVLYETQNAMPLLQQIAEHVFFIAGANNLGVIANTDGGAIAIDTGIDKDTGRLIRKALDEAGLRLQAIINTHHHADHIGGNEYLVRNLPGVVVAAPPIEAALIEHPLLEPGYLNNGAHPPATLQTKWLMAKGVPVQHLLSPGPTQVAGFELEIVPLPGHSINQVGVVAAEVCFAADGFFCAAVLHKHGIPFVYHVGKQLASLQRLATLDAAWFVPGHGECTRRADLGSALAANQHAIERASAAVLDALTTPGTLDAIAVRVQRSLDLAPAAIPQHAILLSAVAAHLSWLAEQNRARQMLIDGTLCWERIA